MIPRCPHGVYDPHGDQSYCSVCNPVMITTGSDLLSSAIGKIGSLKVELYPETAKWEDIIDLEVLEPENNEEFVPTPDDAGLKVVHKVSDNHPDFQKLREKLDSNESFMMGHQIKKIRVHQRKIPERMQTIEGMKKVLEETFPNWKTDENQRIRMSRWNYVAYLTYFVGLSRKQIAEEMNIKPEVVKAILQRIRRVSQGIRANNTGLKKA